MCTRESHLALQADTAAFLAASTHVGWMVDDVETIELRNVACCGSTLARVATFEEAAVQV